jgi:hypothetical protein
MLGMDIEVEKGKLTLTAFFPRARQENQNTLSYTTVKWWASDIYER